ncbi:MAG: methyl-accepting chemotaxis protein [Planctomycetota bacterium]
MRIRGRLMLAFLGCGLLPMLTVSALNLWNAQKGSHEIGAKATQDLRDKAKQQLVAVRDLKKAEITDYFGTIEDQAITLSHDVMIVDAMREFRDTFHRNVEARNLSQAQLGKMRRDLREYYRDSFGRSYRSQNAGRDPGVDQILDSLPDTAIALQHAYIANNANELGSKHILDAADTGTRYDEIHLKYHPSIRGFLESFGYYDIFLIDDETGEIVYSVFKELDFATSLKHGPYRDSNFARAFTEACNLNDRDETVLVDFQRYFPSYEAPASFIASPIYEGKERIGVLVFQMPVDRINELMVREAGIGRTGETILVGDDGRLRCDSARDPNEFSLVEGFRNATAERIHSDTIARALQGHTGVEQSENFRGETAVTAFAPVNLLGLRWAIVSEVTEKEALATVDELDEVMEGTQANMVWFAIVAAAIAVVSVLAVATLITRSLVNPIIATVETLADIADGDGDLTRRLDEKQIGELGELAANFNRFVQRIHSIVQRISGSAGTLGGASTQLNQSADSLTSGATQSKAKSATVSSAAEELSINMQSMARSTGEMSDGVKTVSKAVDEMNETISEIAQNAERSAGVAKEALTATEVSNAKVGEMGSAADEIGQVIEVIQDIAEQTNLLALNATIEAARAGEAGQGFAVVATEVKQLAKQTADATEDIRKRIETMQASTSETVDSIGEISGVIERVNELNGMIASAVEEQSITTRQIAEHIGNTAKSSDVVARGVSESAQATREITENISEVDDVLQETAANAEQSKMSSEQLMQLADEMMSLVQQFRVEADATVESSVTV